jgi:hypothetical protein
MNQTRSWMVNDRLDLRPPLKTFVGKGETGKGKRNRHIVCMDKGESNRTD